MTARTIPLTQGFRVIVDDLDYPDLARYRWYAHRGSSSYWYALNAGVGQMHRYLLKLTPDDPRQVDHINCDGLDNRRCNLRIATPTQQRHNSRKRESASSIYKGVYWDMVKERWRSRITINGRLTSLGYFDKEEDAGRAYVNAAHKHFGEFARGS